MRCVMRALYLNDGYGSYTFEERETLIKKWSCNTFRFGRFFRSFELLFLRFIRTSFPLPAIDVALMSIMLHSASSSKFSWPLDAQIRNRWCQTEIYKNERQTRLTKLLLHEHDLHIVLSSLLVFSFCGLSSLCIATRKLISHSKFVAVIYYTTDYINFVFL